jgi:predicted aspartyl protease
MSTTKCGFDDSPLVSGCDLLVANGPSLNVNVGFDPTYDAKDLTKAPALAVSDILALVDTGATECCIDSQLATRLSLPIVDKRKVAGVGGISEVNVHLAQVYVPALRFTMYGLFSSVHLSAGGQIHSVLIGRTFLKDFVMTYDGPSGTVVLTHHSMFPGGRIFSPSVPPITPDLPAAVPIAPGAAPETAPG